MDATLSTARGILDEDLPIELRSLIVPTAAYLKLRWVCRVTQKAASAKLKGIEAWDTAQSALSSTWSSLEAEHKTYDRLLYKNVSQHKRSLHWRHLKEDNSHIETAPALTLCSFRCSDGETNSKRRQRCTLKPSN